MPHHGGLVGQRCVIKIKTQTDLSNKAEMFKCKTIFKNLLKLEHCCFTKSVQCHVFNALEHRSSSGICRASVLW